MVKATKSTKKNGRKHAAKRGAPMGNQNAAGPHRRRTARPETPVNERVDGLVSTLRPGTNEDPVIQGFDAAKARLTETYEIMVRGMDRARESYLQTVNAVGGTTPSIPSNVPMTRTGRPDLRSVAGREFMKAHPDFEAAPRAD